MKMTFKILMIAGLLSLASIYAINEKLGRIKNIVTIPWFNFENASEFTYEVSKFVKITNGVTNVTLKTYQSTPSGLGALANQTTNSLGISAAFIRKGFNWVDVKPATEQRPFDGLVKSLDMWVWGGNFNYNLEVHLHDYNDYQYVLSFGSLQFYGWQNLSVEIPNSIPQTENYAPRTRGLTFDKFRIYTAPSERFDRFNVFFDYFKIVTDTFRDYYDGYEVEKVIANEITKGPRNPIYEKETTTTSPSK
jgi:hypothetical protein